MAARTVPRLVHSHLLKTYHPASPASRTVLAQSRLSRPAIRMMASKADSDLISKMTEGEKKITGQVNPVKGGPTAQAQKHANQPLNSEVIRDVRKGEEKITGNPNPTEGGPTSATQSILTNVRFPPTDSPDKLTNAIATVCECTKHIWHLQ
jgi:hypothetical protein